MNVVALPNTAATNSRPTMAAADAIKLYAKHKTAAGWCVDFSGNMPILLHALSDRTATTQSIRLEFPRWALAQQVEVDTESYGAFLNSLPDRVMSLLPQVYGKGMRPCDDRFIVDGTGIQLVNIYNPADIGASCPVPAPFDETADLFGQQVPRVLADLLERVFPNEEERRFIVQRLAAIIQNPAKRVRHAVFLAGEGGTGKSTILDILEAAMGGRHIDRSASYAEANDKFSETYCNNIIVAYEDKAIGRGGEAYVYTNMKSVIDYDRRTVQIKHNQRSVQRELHCNIFVTTNNPALFPWDENERRFFAPQKIVHRVSPEESGNFLTQFHTFLKLPEAPAVLHDWLLNVDMTGFDYSKCPRTPYMSELISQTGSMLDCALDDFLGDKDIFHPQTLADLLRAQRHSYKGDELKAALITRGWEWKRQQCRAEGFPDKRIWVWRKNPVPGRHFRDLTEEEHRGLMEVEGAAF